MTEKVYVVEGGQCMMGDGHIVGAFKTKEDAEKFVENYENKEDEDGLGYWATITEMELK